VGTPFLGEVKLVAFNFAPRGWAFCNGQLLPINQNQALFSLLGTTYGGDGRVTFALPNLQGRAPAHVGSSLILGEAGGEQSHTLISNEMPQHRHNVQGTSSPASLISATNNVWAASASGPYSATSNTTMAPQALGTNNGGQPHNNMQPYLVINYIIALQGAFPS
jgi:microcystin-dependent protein